MEKERRFKCFHCSHLNPLKLSHLEEERLAGKIKGDKTKALVVCRTCVKCGEKNIIKLPKGKTEVVIYLGTKS